MKILNMKTIDTNKHLPQNLIIKSAENHLFRIGLCLTTDNHNINSVQRRSQIYKSIFVFIIQFMYFLKSIIILLSFTENNVLLIFLGDFSHFYEIKLHY